ncbi:MAG: hypothetical protein QW794_07665 [Thermosphaera sp.]
MTKDSKHKGRLIEAWVPEELYNRFIAAKNVYGFSRNSAFLRYIVQRWLEDHWFVFAAPRLPPSPPVGAHAEQRGPTPGYEPGLVLEGRIPNDQVTERDQPSNY